MKYKLSKKKVIEAILTEPLKPGRFFHISRKYNSDEQFDDGQCSVCAVGAVLRKTINKNFNSQSGFTVVGDYYTGDRLHEAYIGDNFLSILSTEFESYCDSFGGREDIEYDEVRFHLLNVIEASCPEVLEFEV